MGSFVTFLIFLFIFIWIYVKFGSSFKKSMQRFQGNDHCSSCKSRLRFVNGVYEKVCSKCGSEQP